MENREIKFRAMYKWEWKYFTIQNLALYHLIVEDILLDWWKFYQYTWLKDKNWREIYEGDIVEYVIDWNIEYHWKRARSEILYRNWEWIASHLCSEKWKLPRWYTAWIINDLRWEYDAKLLVFTENYNQIDEVEIIWNIYENPDLLSNQTDGNK